MDAPLQTSSRYYSLLTLAAVLGLAGITVFFVVPSITYRLDRLDMRVYYNSSGWVADGGTLYADVPSEYPLLANLLFAACRVVGDGFPGSPGGWAAFSWCWIAAAWLTFVATAHMLATRVSRDSLWLWLTPAALFFAVFRYDIYPAAATVLALLAIRQGHVLRGALWLGAVIALKGYALFLLPAFCVYVLQNRGWRTVLLAAVAAVAPFALSNLIVLGYGGWDAMLAPFRFHAVRTNNGEGSYDAFYFLTAFPYAEHPTITGPVPLLLQVGSSLLGAALWPRSFADLVHSFLIGLVGFISFSLFYSPQFVLWVLPVACFAASRGIRSVAVAFGWLTFLHCPLTIIYYSKGMTLAAASVKGQLVRLVMLRVVIVLTTFIRFTLMAQACHYFWATRRRRPPALEPIVEVQRLQELAPPARMSVEGRTSANPCLSTLPANN
jgi:hypothetical protein